MSPTLMPIGAIVRAHGVRGYVRVRAYDPSSDALASRSHIFLGDDGSKRVIERASRDKDDWLVKLAGVDDRDAAEALRGREISAPREELPPPNEGEVFIADLIGCDVVDLAGTMLGRVLRVENYGAHDLLVIDRVGPAVPSKGRPGEREALIPFVEPIVIGVDLEARRVTCDPPEGLLDLDAAEAAPGDEPAEDGD